MFRVILCLFILCASHNSFAQSSGGAVHEDALAGCQKIRPLSSIDKAEVMSFYCAGNKKNAPLLVYFPSWSGGFFNLIEIKKMAWSKGWSVLLAKHRGPDFKEIGSPKAIQDVIDAINYVDKENQFDHTRIYGLGLSGGGYMALMTAAKYPDLFAGISIWGSMTDLAVWHDETFKRLKPGGEQALRKVGDIAYSEQIREGLGGYPSDNPKLYFERSPISHIDVLRKVRIDINAGIHDGYHGSVFSIHSVDLFNRIAQPSNKIDALTVSQLTGENTWHPVIEIPDPSYGAKKVLFRSTSNKERLSIFDGDHELIPVAAIHWLEQQKK